MVIEEDIARYLEVSLGVYADWPSNQSTERMLQKDTKEIRGSYKGKVCP